MTEIKPGSNFLDFLSLENVHSREEKLQDPNNTFITNDRYLRVLQGFCFTIPKIIHFCQNYINNLLYCSSQDIKQLVGRVGKVMVQNCTERGFPTLTKVIQVLKLQKGSEPGISVRTLCRNLHITLHLTNFCDTILKGPDDTSKHHVNMNNGLP